MTFAAGLAVLAGVAATVTHFVTDRSTIYRTPYFEFQLAPGWHCHREDSDYICTPTVSDQKKVVVIMTMKERGPSDNLAAYLDHLRRPTAHRDGFSSTVRYARLVRLGSRDWIESLHSSSEVANYDTYYLATTTSLVAMLLTLSTHRTVQNTASNELRSMMATVRTYQR